MKTTLAEIEKAVDEWGFADNPERRQIVRLCEECVRNAIHEFFHFMNKANQMALDRTVTWQELEEFDHNKRFGEKPTEPSPSPAPAS
jgi:hypothetical protein